MLISIVIPVYKVEEYIERCLQSVIAQDYKGDLECLLIDDCTPDNSCAVIGDILDKYDGPIRFRLLHHEKNRGLSAARNTGIDNAQGGYIYFLDSDDYISSDCISKLAAPLTGGDCDIVIGNYTTLGTNVQFPSLNLENCTLSCNEDIVESYMQGEWYMMAWNKLCNLSFIKRHSLYFREGLVNEDNLWSFQYACWAQSLISVDTSTYYYCIREGSIMTSSDVLSFQKNQLLIIGYILEFLENNCFSISRYQTHLRIRYLHVKNYMLKCIRGGIKLDNEFLDIFRVISSKLDMLDGFNAKGVNFLIYNSNRRWAYIALKCIRYISSKFES